MNPKNMVKGRDYSVDVMRGIAILAMAFGHTAAALLTYPAPVWYEFFGGIAPPLFIFLSGLMVAFTAHKNHYRTRYYFIRGLLIVLVGAGIDLFVWKIYPFMTVDILYLIGFSIPLAAIFIQAGAKVKFSMILGIFLLTPVLQLIFGYSEYPFEYFLTGELTLETAARTSVLNHYFIDGWFPFFPWLGFSFLGAFIYDFRYSRSGLKFKISHYLSVGILLISAGILIWLLDDPHIITRLIRGGAFMPPGLGYLFWSVGIIFLMFAFLDWCGYRRIFQPVIRIGQFSLFIYVIHLFLIEFLLRPVLGRSSQNVFYLSFLTLVLVLYPFVILLRYVRAYLPTGKIYVRLFVR